MKNDEGLTALEVCTNDEAAKLIQEKIKEKLAKSQEYPKENPTNNENEPKTNLEVSQSVPAKTPIVMGWLYKTGPLIFNIKRRFFVLDPYDGTFIRFKNREDYPLKPRFYKLYIYRYNKWNMMIYQNMIIYKGL